MTTDPAIDPAIEAMRNDKQVTGTGRQRRHMVHVYLSDAQYVWLHARASSASCAIELQALADIDATNRREIARLRAEHDDSMRQAEARAKELVQRAMALTPPSDDE